MDDVVNRFARELADAIAAAVAENPQVEACREKARAAGFEMKVTLEAVVGFVNRSQSAALAKVTHARRAWSQPRRTFEVTANDRRFLRSLRIAADETAEPSRSRRRVRRQNLRRAGRCSASRPFFFLRHRSGTPPQHLCRLSPGLRDRAAAAAAAAAGSPR